jgi:hypothetical protein
MAKHRDPLPEDLKELISLCRAGKLFAVQEWIDSGKRYKLPEGNFITSPFDASIEVGFHSLVEIFLRAGIDQEDKDSALTRAVCDSRLDLVELLVSFGADIGQVCRESVICNRNPLILRWFVSHGMDLEDGNMILYAFRAKNWGFLGAFLDIRDRVPSARKQAAMALRLHARAGNLKWVSLLLWAGADPRMIVPDPESSPAEEFSGTALGDAICYGKVDVVKKFKIDPRKDNPTQLLSEFIAGPNIEILQMLLDAGADPIGASSNRSPMQNLIRSLGWEIASTFFHRDQEPILQCIELLASKGSRWMPTEKHEISSLRRALGKAEAYKAVSALNRLMKCEAIDREVFSELLRTFKAAMTWGTIATPESGWNVCQWSAEKTGSRGAASLPSIGRAALLPPLPDRRDRKLPKQRPTATRPAPAPPGERFSFDFFDNSESTSRINCQVEAKIRR